MGFFELIRRIWGIGKQLEKSAAHPAKPLRQWAWYLPREISPVQLQELTDELIDPLRSFVSEVRVRSDMNQRVWFDVELRRGLKWFDFQMECMLSDLWHDPWTSTADLEIVSVRLPHLTGVVSETIQGLAGRWLIRLFDFAGPLLRRDRRKGAVIRVQARTLHMNFRPWVEEYFQSATASVWLESFFGSTGQTNRGRRMIARTVIFGAETSGGGQLSLHMYRLPGKVDVTPVAVHQETSGSLYWGGIFEWSISLATSIILVSLLVPFALAYLSLEPVHFNDLFSLPKILAYNVAIVLVPFWILRMTMMPVRQMWSRRQGQVEVLRAEVERDRIFLPLLRNWVLEMRRMEMSGNARTLQDKVREWILRIGEQRRLLQAKLRDIEKQRRISTAVLIMGYVAVTVLEYALWQGYISGPGVYAEKIHSLLGRLLLGK